MLIEQEAKMKEAPKRQPRRKDAIEKGHTKIDHVVFEESRNNED
jgi:hypothetical protein